MVQALRAAGIRVVAETAHGEEGVQRAQGLGATFLLLGSVRDALLPDLVRRAVGGESPVRVVVLFDQVGRDVLAAIVALGVDALLVRSVRPEELADALGRVEKGERVIAPVLLPLLVGALGPSVEDEEPAEGGLTRKEVEVLARLAQGLSNREIADALYVTPATVKTHLAHIYAKLDVTNRQQALARAVALGLLG